MTLHAHSPKARLAAVSALAAALVLASESIFPAQTGQIPVSATVGQGCGIATTVDVGLPSALGRALTTPGSHIVTVGSVIQTCNKKAGFTLAVSSLNCPTTALGSLAAAAGAKLINGSPGSEEYQMYSVTFTNPSGANPAGLLATICTPAIGREVTGAKVAGQSSSIDIAFTTGINDVGGDIAGAGTFSDVLVFEMSVK